MKNNLPRSQSVVAWTVGWHHHGEGMADLRISNWFQSNLSIPTSITESLPLSEGLPTHVTVPEKTDTMISSNSSSLQKLLFSLYRKDYNHEEIISKSFTLFYWAPWQCSGRSWNWPAMQVSYMALPSWKGHDGLLWWTTTLHCPPQTRQLLTKENFRQIHRYIER